MLPHRWDEEEKTITWKRMLPHRWDRRRKEMKKEMLDERKKRITGKGLIKNRKKSYYFFNWILLIKRN